MRAVRFALTVVMLVIALWYSDGRVCAQSPCRCEGSTSKAIWWSNLDVEVRIEGCTPSAAAGSAYARAGCALAEMVTKEAGDHPPCCQDSECFSSALRSANEAAAAQDLFADPISISVSEGAQSICGAQVAGLGASSAGVWPSSVRMISSYGPGSQPNMFYRSNWTLRRSPETVNGAESFMGFAGPFADSGAVLTPSFDGITHCRPTVVVKVMLQRAFDPCFSGECVCVEGVRATAADPAPQTVVRWTNIAVSMTQGGRTTTETVLQGVAAEISDSEGLSSIRLGIFNSPEFAQDPLPDGQEVSGERTIEIGPPANDVTEITATSFTDAFSEFDCDIDRDGAACPEDAVLMQSLAADAVLLGDLRYSARADFDLNGLIDAADLTAFDATYAASPDCNHNGQPDGCDIVRGSSHDTNQNGIPDECEKGDMNCDGVRNGRDVSPFVFAFIDPAVYNSIYVQCDATRADIDDNGSTDAADISSFVDLLLVGP